MVDNAAKRLKKLTLSEEDVCNLLQKYTATQLMTLLREVSQWPEVKLDWKGIVSKTATGITNAREYQMLWRHLAYRLPLADKVDPDAEPLDDDSDLEYELEPSPPVSAELIAEAANCVKAIALGPPNESSMPNNATIENDVPNGQAPKIPSEHPQFATLLPYPKTTISSFVQKPSQLAGASGEGLDSTGGILNCMVSRRKRKPWSEEEDLELISAVRKFGEGNWATIVKGDFKGDRTPSQLSQRWAIIRKKQVMGLGVSGSQLSEQQLATRHAIDMALKDTLTAIGNGAATANTANLNTSNEGSPVTNTNTMPPQVQQLPQATNITSMKPRPTGPVTVHPFPKKAPAKSTVTTDSIQAAAVAAGARIASASDAAHLIKATQRNNKAVHIRAGVPSAAGTTGSLPPNVHFIRTGLAASSPTVASGSPSYTAGSHQAKGSTVKPSVPAATVSRPKTAPTVALERSNSANFANELQKMEDKVCAKVKVPSSSTKPMVDVQQDGASLSRCLPKSPTEKHQTTSPSEDVDCSKQTSVVDNNPQCTLNTEMTEQNVDDSKQPVEDPVPMDSDEKPSADKGSGDPGVNRGQDCSPDSVADTEKKEEFSGEAEAVVEKS